jgi:Kef-type K+ transport system membrane component KefB
LQISYVFYKLKLPRIIGDIIAGIILGPTVLQDAAFTLNSQRNNSAVKTIGYCGIAPTLAFSSSPHSYSTQVLF